MTTLISTVAASLSVPRADAADSFVLHAPLELLARVGLLDHVAPAGRDAAAFRLRRLGELFEQWGPPVDTVGPDVPAPALAAALDSGDLDGVDAAVVALASTTGAAALRDLLADQVITRLAAAGHAPILLALLPRIAGGALPVELLRQPARELARNPSWRLGWFDTIASGGPATLATAIAALPRLASPASTFIYPLMHGVEEAGIGEHLATGVGAATVDEARRVLLRAAAHSMLIEPDEEVPYGWTHCLTMPQAVLDIAAACASPRRAIAVAATYVAGFRCQLGTVDLATPFEPVDPAMDLTAALREAPELAAASVLHTPPEELATVRTILATEASARHDAHLVKYTLASLEAAAADPPAARVYLAAAARLLGYWVRNPDPADALSAAAAS